MAIIPTGVTLQSYRPLAGMLFVIILLVCRKFGEERPRNEELSQRRNYEGHSMMCGSGMQRTAHINQIPQGEDTDGVVSLVPRLMPPAPFPREPPDPGLAFRATFLWLQQHRHVETRGEQNWTDQINQIPQGDDTEGVVLQVPRLIQPAPLPQEPPDLRSWTRRTQPPQNHRDGCLRHDGPNPHRTTVTETPQRMFWMRTNKCHKEMIRKE